MPLLYLHRIAGQSDIPVTSSARVEPHRELPAACGALPAFSTAFWRANSSRAMARPMPVLPGRAPWPRLKTLRTGAAGPPPQSPAPHRAGQSRYTERCACRHRARRCLRGRVRRSFFSRFSSASTVQSGSARSAMGGASRISSVTPASAASGCTWSAASNSRALRVGLSGPQRQGVGIQARQQQQRFLQARQAFDLRLDLAAHRAARRLACQRKGGQRCFQLVGDVGQAARKAVAGVQRRLPCMVQFSHGLAQLVGQRAE